MATTSSHLHPSSRTSYSPRTSYSRPKLLRSCVTAPMLVTSYASRDDRSSLSFSASGLHSKDKATTLLNRVASHSDEYSEKSEERQKQVERIINSPPASRREIGKKGVSGKSKKLSMQAESDGEKHGAYFSFPSFEEFEGRSEREESNRRQS